MPRRLLAIAALLVLFSACDPISAPPILGPATVGAGYGGSREPHTSTNAPARILIAFEGVTIGGGWSWTTETPRLTGPQRQAIYTQVADYYKRWNIDVVLAGGPRALAGADEVVVHVGDRVPDMRYGGKAEIDGIHATEEWKHHAFVSASSAGYDTFTISMFVAHEAGHALGLSHFPGDGLMRPTALLGGVTWSAVEIAAMDALYPLA